MSASPSRSALHRRGRAPWLWLCAVGLMGLGSVYALRSTDHAASESVLHGVGKMAQSPSVLVRSLVQDAARDEVRVAALRLGLRWQERGFRISFSGAASSTLEDPQAPNHEVLVGTFDPAIQLNPEQQKRTWESFGLRRDAEAWVMPDGGELRTQTSVLSITLSRQHVADAIERLKVVGLQGAVSSEAEIVTLVLAPTKGGVEFLEGALRALSKEPPPTAPRVVLWSSGQRVLQVALDGNGHGTARTRAFVGTMDAPVDSTSYPELAESAQQFRAAIRSLARDPESGAPTGAHQGVPIKVAELQSVEAYTRDGALHRCGWYDAGQHRLVVVRGLPASVDDALEDFLETELLRTFGWPTTPWFMRGLVYVFTGRVGGIPLTSIEPWNAPVTLDDVVASQRPRTRFALAPVEARLARGVLAEFNSDVGAAWDARLAEDEEMLDRLQAQWKGGLVKAPVVALEAAPRPWSGGVAVEVTCPVRGVGQLGSGALHDDFQRIASLGFRGVQLSVQVPVAPPSASERREVPFDLRGWGYSVTLEGDGALLASVAAARALGLSVIIAPRFVTSAAAGLGRTQVHGTPERVELYGNRRALAMEGIAWLAEQAGADALVLFDPEELPTAKKKTDPSFKKAADAARSRARVKSMDYASPFTGERLAFCYNPATMGYALASGEFDDRPAAGLGLELRFDDKALAKFQSARVLRATEMVGGQLRALRIRHLDRNPPGEKETTWTVLSRFKVGAPGGTPGGTPGETSEETRTARPPHGVLLGPWHLGLPPLAARRGSPSADTLEGTSALNLRDLDDERLRALSQLPR